MDAETVQDPFVSVTKLCQPTASQDAKFLSCPFARQSEHFPDSNFDQSSSSPDPTPSYPAEIVMVSPPGSISSAREQAENDAVFHTPPEHHLPSYFSAEDENLDELYSDGTRTDRSKPTTLLEGGLDDRFESKKVRVPVKEFWGETAPAGETEAIVDEVEGNGDVQDEADVIVLDSTGSGGNMAISNLVDDDSVDMMGVGKIDELQKTIKLSKDGVANVNGNHRLGRESMENIPQLNQGKKIHENSCCCGNFNSVKNKEEIVNLGNEMRHESGVGGSDKVIKDGKIPKNSMRIDDFRYVSEGDNQRSWKERTGRERRQLPESLEEKGKNLGNENARETVEESKSSKLMDFLDVLKVIVVRDKDGGCEDVDFLQTARKRGLTFPRPRWWSAEGEDGE